ncbi:hypothetical protein KAR91_70355 [Candidatus Pacearchaeota archaeon]|nr:hypothetical protein [Candidatus Pacearchaeota archaeon]
MKLDLLTTCVNSTAEAIDNMTDQAKEISFSTFKKHVDTLKIEEDFSYAGSVLRLKNDYHVKYFKSKYKGRPCYYMVHSAIEYVYC